MSVAKRAYQGEMVRFNRQMKRPLQLVADMMPIGFTDEEYYKTFKVCFAGLWHTIEEKKRTYDLMDKERKRKHQEPIYFFPQLYDFLAKQSCAIRNKTRNKHQQGQILGEAERIALKAKYETRSKHREAAKEKKKTEITELQQAVTPKFANYFIKTYFYVKRTHPEDVNTRMRILEEAAKFKCAETISLMFKVNAAERNFKLREFAFLTLQKQFGYPQVHLHRNRNGKLHPGDDLMPRKMDTPQLLMEEIYQSEYNLEQNKKFDVFLSHSSKDKEAIIKLKAMLNRQGLTVYIDWIEDRNALKRELTSVDTARAITERINHSRAVLYVLSETGLTSVWTPWELGYAQALGKKICVLPMGTNIKAPEYLDIYNRAVVEEDKVFVKMDNKRVLIEEWIS